MKCLFVYFILLFIWLRVNAVSVDSLLFKEYKRGYEVVYEIIESNCLKDSLTKRSFCSLFLGNLWAITVKNEYSYVLYYGYRIGNEEVTRKVISNREVVLNRLFSLDQKKIEAPIYKPTDFYTPFYWYFVLSDSLHNTKFEWNANSKSDDEYAKIFFDVFTDYYVYLMNITYDEKRKLRKIKVKRKKLKRSS